jgi:DNA-binding transcriptional LysR family regulator
LLEKGHADLGIFSPSRLSRAVAVAARSPIRFEVVARRSYRLSRRSNSWARLVEYPFVLTDRSTVIRQALEELLRRNDLLTSLQIGAEVATFDLAIEAVRAGCGVGIIPVGPRLEGRLRGLTRIEPPPGLPGIDIAVLRRSDLYLPRYLRHFIDVAAGAIAPRDGPRPMLRYNDGIGNGDFAAGI